MMPDEYPTTPQAERCSPDPEVSAEQLGDEAEAEAEDETIALLATVAITTASITDSAPVADSGGIPDGNDPTAAGFPQPPVADAVTDDDDPDDEDLSDPDDTE